MSKKEQIIKDTFHFTSARYIAQGVGFFTAILLRKFLGPFNMGIWSLLKIVVGYSSYLLLGIDQGASYKIPFLMGQKDAQNEEEVKNVVFSFVMVIAVLTGIGLIIAAFLLRNTYPHVAVIGLIVLSVYIIFDKFCGYYQLVLRAKKNFALLSGTIIFDCLLNLVLVIILVSKFSIYGLYGASIILVLANIAYMHVFAKYVFKFNFNLRILPGLIKIGLPITIVGLFQWGLETIDSIMIAKMIGVTYVGYYSIPVMTRGYIKQLSSFGTVLYPHIIESYGEKQDIETIKKYVIVPPMVNAYILPLVLGLTFFIIPLLVETVLPGFVPGILALQILLIGMFFNSCSAQAYHFIFALNKQFRIIPIIISVTLLDVIGNYCLIKMGYGIYGVAAVNSVAMFLCFIILQVYAMGHFAQIREIILFLFKIIFPLLYTISIVLMLERFVIMNNLFISSALKSALLVFFSLPLLVYVNRKTEVISLVFRMLQKFVYGKRI